MSKPSELREAIKNIPFPVDRNLHFEPKDRRLTVGTFLPEQTIDAILNAVIASLKANTCQDHSGCFGKNCQGYKDALMDVDTVLQSAKSNKDSHDLQK